MISLDPHEGVDGAVYLDLAEMGLATPGGHITVVDELDGHSYVWGSSNWVELSPVSLLPLGVATHLHRAGVPRQNRPPE